MQYEDFKDNEYLENMTSLVYYVLVYIVANLAAFGIISIIEQKSDKVELDDYNGLYLTNPKLSFIMFCSARKYRCNYTFSFHIPSISTG